MRKPSRFRLSTDYTFDLGDSGKPYQLPPFYWSVTVYDTQEQMIRRGRALGAEWAGNKSVSGRVMACVLPQETLYINTKAPKHAVQLGRRVLHPKIGHAIFWRRRVDTEVVAHEAVHIATSTLRTTGAFPKMSKDGITPSEELFAYVIGMVSSRLMAGMAEMNRPIRRFAT